MASAASGHEFTFRAGPAVLGLVIHMMTGAMAGAMFGAAVAALRLTRGITVAAGAAFGLMVLLANSFIGLPLMASLFGGGDAISHMPQVVGWGTFTVEHLIYGLVLGAVVSSVAVVTRTAEYRRVPAQVS